MLRGTVLVALYPLILPTLELHVCPASLYLTVENMCHHCYSSWEPKTDKPTEVVGQFPDVLLLVVLGAM